VRGIPALLQGTPPLKMSPDNIRTLIFNVGLGLYGSCDPKFLDREYFDRLDVFDEYHRIRKALKKTPLWDFTRRVKTYWSSDDPPSDEAVQIELEMRMFRLCAAWRFMPLILASILAVKGVGVRVQHFLNTTAGLVMGRQTSRRHALAQFASFFLRISEAINKNPRGGGVSAFDNFQMNHHGSSATSGDAKGGRFTSGMDGAFWLFFNAPLDGADPLLLPPDADAWSPALKRPLVYGNAPKKTRLIDQLLEESEELLEYTIKSLDGQERPKQRNTRKGQGAADEERARDPFMRVLLAIRKKYYVNNPGMRPCRGSFGLKEEDVPLGYCKWKSDGLYDNACMLMYMHALWVLAQVDADVQPEGNGLHELMRHEAASSTLVGENPDRHSGLRKGRFAHDSSTLGSGASSPTTRRTRASTRCGLLTRRWGRAQCAPCSQSPSSGTP
jgi:hypothetical protein